MTETAYVKIGTIYSDFKESLRYIMNPRKTLKQNSKYSGIPFCESPRGINVCEREYFVEGINCIPANAVSEFTAVKRQFYKTDKMQAYNVTISFEETDISPELAHKAGKEFAKMLFADKFQTVMATHMNTNHLHCHFIFNSVSFRDGKRLDLEYLGLISECADKACDANNLSCFKCENYSTRTPYNILQLEKAGVPTKYNIMRAAVDYAVEYCHSYKDFEYILRQLGYNQKKSPNGFLMLEEKCDKRAVKFASLGKEYYPEKILERINERKGINFKSFTSPVYFKEPQYKMEKRTDYILKNKSGLPSLYLVYLTSLGFFSYENVDPLKVNYVLRDEIMHAKEAWEEYNFLKDSGIDSPKDLKAFEAEINEKIQSISSERHNLRKICQRSSVPENEKEKISHEISRLTDCRKILSNEMKLCRRTEGRKDNIKSKLETAKEEEEKYRRKEKEHEHIR